MRSLIEFVKSTLIGGIVFLLPVGIVVVVLAKLAIYARRAGDALHQRLFPGAQGDLLPLLFAVVLLLAVAFAAGVLARSSLGARLFGWLDSQVLGRFPVYALVRQTVADMAGGSVALASGAETRVVLVRFDDSAQLAFLVERAADGTCTVFLPDAPSAMSGSVVFVAAERVFETSLTPAAVVQGMRRLGTGLDHRV